jgi:hypothetical protein
MYVCDEIELGTGDVAALTERLQQTWCAGLRQGKERLSPEVPP